MPDPLTMTLGGITLFLGAVLVAVGRFTRLRKAIDETASALRACRDDTDPDDVTEAEDRRVALAHLHAAQVRTWNAMGQTLPWRIIRPLVGWQPLPDAVTRASGPVGARDQGAARS